MTESQHDQPEIPLNKDLADQYKTDHPDIERSNIEYYSGFLNEVDKAARQNPEQTTDHLTPDGNHIIRATFDEGSGRVIKESMRLSDRNKPEPSLDEAVSEAVDTTPAQPEVVEPHYNGSVKDGLSKILNGEVGDDNAREILADIMGRNPGLIPTPESTDVTPKADEPLDEFIIRFAAYDRPAVIRAIEWTLSPIPIIYHIVAGTTHALFPPREKVTTYTPDQAKKLVKSRHGLREVIRLLSTNSNNCDSGDAPTWMQRMYAVVTRRSSIGSSIYINLDYVFRPTNGADYTTNPHITHEMTETISRFPYIPKELIPRRFRIKGIPSDDLVKLLSDPNFVSTIKIGNQYDKDHKGRYILRPAAVGAALAAGVYYGLGPLTAMLLDEILPGVPQQVQDLYYSGMGLLGLNPANKLVSTADELDAQRQKLETEGVIMPDLTKEHAAIASMLKEMGEDYNQTNQRLTEVFTNVHSSATGVSVALVDGANNFIFKPTAGLLGLREEYNKLQKFVGQELTVVALQGQRHIIEERYGAGTTDLLIENIRQYGSIRKASAATELEMTNKKNEEMTQQRRELLEGVLREESEGLSGDVQDMMDYLGSIRTTYRVGGSVADTAQRLGEIVEEAGREYINTRNPEALSSIREYLKSDEWRSALEDLRKENSQEGKMVANFFGKVEEFFEVVHDANSSITELNQVYFDCRSLRDQYRGLGRDAPLFTEDKIDALDEQLKGVYEKAVAAHERINTSTGQAAEAYRDRFGEAGMREANWGDVTGFITAGLAFTILAVAGVKSIYRAFTAPFKSKN